MSLAFRRGISTLIPPKIASPSGIGAAQDAVRMKRVVSFYEKLPRGPNKNPIPRGLISRYRARYFEGEKASAAPIFHIVGLLLLFGYGQEYYFHLRHHKNNAH